MSRLCQSPANAVLTKRGFQTEPLPFLPVDDEMRAALERGDTHIPIKVTQGECIPDLRCKYCKGLGYAETPIELLEALACFVTPSGESIFGISRSPQNNTDKP